MKSIEELKNEIDRLQQQRKPHNDALTLIAQKEKENYQLIIQHFQSVFSTEYQNCKNDFERLAMYINHKPVQGYEYETSFENMFHYSESDKFKKLFETYKNEYFDINMYIAYGGIILNVNIYDNDECNDRNDVLRDERFKSFLNGLTPFLKHDFRITMEHLQPITYKHDTGKWMDDFKELKL